MHPEKLNIAGNICVVLVTELRTTPQKYLELLTPVYGYPLYQKRPTYCHLFNRPEKPINHDAPSSTFVKNTQTLW